MQRLEPAVLGERCCGMMEPGKEKHRFLGTSVPPQPLSSREKRGEEFPSASGAAGRFADGVCLAGCPCAAMAPAPALPGWAGGTTSGGCSLWGCEHPLPHLPQLRFMSSLCPLPRFWGKP